MEVLLNIAVMASDKKCQSVANFYAERRTNFGTVDIVVGCAPSKSKTTDRHHRIIHTFSPFLWIRKNLNKYDAIEVSDANMSTLLLALLCRKTQKPLIFRAVIPLTWFQKFVFRIVSFITLGIVVEPDSDSFYSEVREAIEGWLSNEPIESVYTPLRYDVLVRLRFIEWYERNKIIYVKDKERFMEDAKKTDFFFQQTRVSRKSKRFKWSEDEAEIVFRERVDSFISMYEDIRWNGFDAKHKIQLHAASKIVETDTGKMVTHIGYIGNGCHRLSILIVLQRAMRKEYFYFSQKDAYKPRDNTIEYLKTRKLGRKQYINFMQKFYAGQQSPKLLDEMKNVVVKDAQFFSCEPNRLIDAILDQKSN